MTLKIKTLSRALALLCTVTVSQGVLAGDSTTLEIRGVIKPPSCNIDFQGGGRLDWGKIRASELNRDHPTWLSQKKTSLNVSCASPTLFSIKSKDVAELAGTPLDGVPDPALQFSLGATRENKLVGVYRISTIREASQLNGKPGIFFVSSDDHGANWTRTNTIEWSNSDTLNAFSDSVMSVPVVASSVMLHIQVTPAISPADELGKLENIPLNGNATFDIVYL
ncbi:DUF1120 domain-containing protein [Erwinia sp. LJJL01]|uniref:DUF1120 domain-containing protein n=1 Tax=Erwinia sp. LJJL01 TaxID=3391839 RepID=UPI00105B2489